MSKRLSHGVNKPEKYTQLSFMMPNQSHQEYMRIIYVLREYT